MADLISGKDVASLTHDGFRSVLNALITAEADLHGVSLIDVDLTTRDTDADAGIDGQVKWPTSVVHEVLGSGETALQYKSGQLTLANLRSEFAKPGIKAVLKAGGSYVLLVGRDYVKKSRGERERVLKQLCKRKKLDPTRCKILYGDQIARWISRFPGVVIMPELGKGYPAFVTVRTWAHLPNLRNPYHGDPSRTATIDAIRKFVRDAGGGTVLRVEGPAGVGKTRVLLEALNEDGIAPRAIYCCNAEDPNAQALLAALVSQPLASAIVVLDECDRDRQGALTSYADLAGGRVRLICAGVTDVLFQAPVGLSDVYTLLPLGDADIRQILTEYRNDAPAEIVDTAVRVSGGYVKLAMFVVNTLISRSDLPLTVLTKIDNIRTFLERFVTPTTFKTLKALSLLSKVGWRDERRVEAESLAEVVGLLFTEMQEAVKTLKDQGVVMERGYCLYVSPDLLAISAAAAMWDERGPTLISIVEKLPSTEPKRQLLRRLATMRDHGPVRQAVERLLGPSGLYKTIQDLNQEFLAEIFRFFAATLPEPALEVLDRLIAPARRSELLGFNLGRREIVWALESLVRWPETSLRAARVLGRLAITETEDIGNNATGVFQTYFHAFLSGSPVPLSERLKLVDELLSESTPESRLLAAKAAAAALTYHESRMGGDLDHISKRTYPDEWRPKTWGELWDARRYAIKQLRVLAEGSDEASTVARTELLQSVFTLGRDGQATDAVDLLSAFIPRTDAERRQRFDAAQRLRGTAGPTLDPVHADSLQTLINSSFPDTVSDQLRRWVGRRAHSDFDAGGAGFSAADEKTIALADRAFREGLSDDDLRWLASPEAENVWVLGKHLGELDTDGTLLDRVIAVSPTNLNAVLLASYLSGMGDNKRDDILDKLATSHRTLAFVASWRGNVTRRSGERVLSLMDQVDRSLWGALRYGGWVESLPDDLTEIILKKMLSDKDTAPTAQSVLSHIVNTKRDWLLKRLDLLWAALNHHPTGPHGEWEWAEVARVGVSINAERVALSCLDFLLASEGPNISSDPVVSVLADSTRAAPSQVWPHVADALLQKNRTAFRLLLSLQHWYGELIPAADLVEWAKSNGRHARLMAAELITITAPLNERARALVRAFPRDEEILRIFAGSLFGGSWVGPISAHTESILHKVQVLCGDSDHRIADWAGRLATSLERDLEKQKLIEEEEEL